MARKGDPPELQQRVVALVEGGGKISKVADELGISEQTISTWHRWARIGAGPLPGVRYRATPAAFGA